MPTPPLSDELAQEAATAYELHNTITAAAQALGLVRATFRDRLYHAAERGMLGFGPVLPGFRVSKATAVTNKDGDVVRQFIQQKPEPGGAFAVPAGHVIKGVSALIDPGGRELAKWVKTREGLLDPLELAEKLKVAFADYAPAAQATPAPPAPATDLLNLIPCNDWHINLLAWRREVGENWDLKIAESVIGAAVEDIISRAPSASTAIILGGGDLLHADTNDNRTAKSGNILDADGRHQKGIEVAHRLKLRTIDAALKRNDRVIVRILKGNHDEYSSVAVAYFLLAWYRNEPRVTVDVDASLFWWHRFGSVLLGATHGHTVKIEKMPGIMAHRRAEDWGLTKFRYVHGFHLHHSARYATEGDGVISEIHQAPVPEDAWHFGSGYLSGRSMQAITYHREFGEIGRVRVALMDGGE